jgi:hypothetical protein
MIVIPDDAAVTALLTRDQAALVEVCSLPSASQALWRLRLQAPRRRAARVASLVDRALMCAGGMLAAAAVVALFAYFPLSGRASAVVIVSLTTGVTAMLTAWVATESGDKTPLGHRRN